MNRDWMTTGADLTERVGGQDAVAAAIEALDWQEIPEDGSLTVGFIPGESINACIRELRIPRVTQVAISAFEIPGKNGEDGFYPGFYGIEGNFTNGRARIYVLDVGTAIQSLCCDFWPGEGTAAKAA